MRYIFLLIVFFVASQRLMAQSNLVLNPSFEEKDTCPYYTSGISDSNCIAWDCPSLGTADYFNDCGICYICPEDFKYSTTESYNFAGFQVPHFGAAYSGIIAYYNSVTREYIQGHLRDSIKFGQRYIIQFYVSVAEKESHFCIDNLGVYFSDLALNYSTSSDRIPLVPQFQNPAGNYLNNFIGWQKIQGTFVANGGERYFSIGNFDTEPNIHRNDCKSNGIPPYGVYLYIDDVAVIDTSIIDTVQLCRYDSIQLGGAWRNQNDTGIVFTDTIQGLFVRSIIQSSPYPAYHTYVDLPFRAGDSIKAGYVWIYEDSLLVLHYTTPYNCDSAVYYNCRTNVGLDELVNDKGLFTIFPNPSEDFIEIKLFSNDLASFNVSIFNIEGKAILTSSLEQNRIDITILNSGMYFVKLVNIKSGEVLGVRKFVKE